MVPTISLSHSLFSLCPETHPPPPPPPHLCSPGPQTHPSPHPSIHSCSLPASFAHLLALFQFHHSDIFVFRDFLFASMNTCIILFHNLLPFLTKVCPFGRKGVCILVFFFFFFCQSIASRCPCTTAAVCVQLILAHTFLQFTH